MSGSACKRSWRQCTPVGAFGRLCASMIGILPLLLSPRRTPTPNTQVSLREFGSSSNSHRSLGNKTPEEFALTVSEGLAS